MRGVYDPMKKEEKCVICGTKDNLEFGPDPYALEICDDDTEVWECSKCREQQAEEI